MMTTFNPLFYLSLLLLLGISALSHKTCKPEFFQFFMKIHSDCTIERLLKNDPVPPHFDSKTHVETSDVIIDSKTNVRGRLYRPTKISHGYRAPILVYFHGGGFLVGSPFDRQAQDQLLRISSMGKTVILSVDYKLAPENQIPVPYANGEEALKWLAIQASGQGNHKDKWLIDVVNFKRVFIGGQSSGGNIAYNVAMRFQQNKINGLNFAGLVLIHPYFLMAKPSQSLMNVPVEMRNNVTSLWSFACPKTGGLADTWVNPSLETKLHVLKPGRVLICVAEKDPLIDAAKAFYDVVKKKVITEYYITKGRGHSFDTTFPNVKETTYLYSKIASFLN